MGLKSELEDEVKANFEYKWTKRDGQIVPEREDLQLGNDAVKLQATVLYAEMADSTDLLDGHESYFAAEIYKAYLRCAARIIKHEQGTITAYNGDRVMAVFLINQKYLSSSLGADDKLRHSHNH